MKHTQDSGKKGDEKCPTCTDNTFNEFLNDLENDMRMEKYDILWKKYRKVIISVGVLLISSITFYGLWQRYDANRTEEAAGHFIQLQEMISQGRVDEALSIVNYLAENAPKYYKVLSKFTQAGLLAKTDFSKNVEKIQSLYKAIIKEKKIPSYLRDLASILWVNSALQKNGKVTMDEATARKLLKTLKPCCKQKDGLALLAQELRGVIFYQIGDLKHARKAFDKVSKNAQTPPSMRSRASIMTQAIQDKSSAESEKEEKSHEAA